jgi:hypothetical protein
MLVQPPRVWKLVPELLTVAPKKGAPTDSTKVLSEGSKVNTPLCPELKVVGEMETLKCAPASALILSGACTVLTYSTPLIGSKSDEPRDAVAELGTISRTTASARIVLRTFPDTIRFVVS